jgi:hypothetical protein
LRAFLNGRASVRIRRVDRFQLFRLSLTPREVDLFTPEPPSRERYLRSIFEMEQRFAHRTNPFVYVPHVYAAVATAQPLPIIGQIGRRVVTIENLPPDQGFALAQHEGWRAAVIALDPTSHPDGQKLAFSIDTHIGTPFAVLSSFIKHLNRQDPPYHIEAEPIFSPRTFWAFAEEHRGEVTSLRFEFVTPNMFGTADALSDDLRSFRNDEGAQLVDIKLRSDDGLKTDTPRVRASVEYAGRGAGKILAFAKGGKHYNSREQVQTVIVEDGKEPLLIRALERIYEILGI